VTQRAGNAVTQSADCDEMSDEMDCDEMTWGVDPTSDRIPADDSRASAYSGPASPSPLPPPPSSRARGQVLTHMDALLTPFSLAAYRSQQFLCSDSTHRSRALSHCRSSDEPAPLLTEVHITSPVIASVQIPCRAGSGLVCVYV
jgi:hypothetical protein